MITTSLPIAFILLMNYTPLELFEHGGIIMWPILIISLLGITVAVERILFIIRESSSREPEVVEKMLEHVEARDIEGAIELGKKSKDFVFNVTEHTETDEVKDAETVDALEAIFQ